MIIYKKKRRTTEVLDDIVCDICGKSCYCTCDFELATLHAVWGYGSSKDGQEWVCEMCESCSEKIKEFIESLGGVVKIG
jgi:hypothetical protein